MPGAARWRWQDSPFSYEKLCYMVPVMVIVTILLSDFFYAWLPKSDIWSLVIVSSLSLAALLFVYKVVWRFIPERVTARVPYNFQEAQMSKGDVRSFWQFCRVLIGRG